MSGHTVKTFEDNFEKGYNAIEVKTTDLGSTGVFYYRIDTPKYSGTKKMVIVK
jgi:hypothetical protein